jgi:hypothetical protein
MRPPGGLDELGASGARAWDEHYRSVLTKLERRAGPNPYLRPAPNAEMPWRTTPDWLGFPSRVAECVTRAAALPALDRGARALQEEYLEWRVVRDGDAIHRVEFTTELADYWRVLAAHEPARTVALVAELAGRPVAPEELFGDARTPGERETAFGRTMLTRDGMSPLNDGREAICCMVEPSNSLVGLLRLAFAATTPRIVRDVLSGRLRCLTCDEAIPQLGGSAVQGRASDPVLVERLGRLAYEDRLIAFDDPLGIYLGGVEHGRLRTPDGGRVPAGWFVFSRGRQRLVLECPPETGLVVSDLVDVATEQPIRHGGQVAELVQLIVRLRVSDAGAAGGTMPDPVEVARAESDARDCAGVQRAVAALAEGP